MRELIEAAEAVIGRWDRSPLSVDSLTMNDLRDAVKQAESDKVDRDDALFAACMYGAKTERERIKEIVRSEYPYQGIYFERIMERIDDL